MNADDAKAYAQLYQSSFRTSQLVTRVLILHARLSATRITASVE